MNNKVLAQAYRERLIGRPNKTQPWAVSKGARGEQTGTNDPIVFCNVRGRRVFAGGDCLANACGDAGICLVRSIIMGEHSEYVT